MAKIKEEAEVIETPKIQIEELTVTQFGNEGLNAMATKLNEVIQVLNK